MKGFISLPIFLIAVLLFSVGGILAYQKLHQTSVPAPQATPSPTLSPTSSPTTTPTTKTISSNKISPTFTPTPTPVVYLTSVKLVSVSPSSGNYGQVITLSGSGFGSSTGHVSFYNSQGQNSGWGPTDSWSDTEIKLKAPPFQGGSKMMVEVQHSDGTKSNQIPFVLAAGQPYISSISPSSVSPNSELVISGNGFGNSTGTVKLYDMSPDSCPITSWTENEIRCKIPANTPINQRRYLGITTADGRERSQTGFNVGN